MARILLAWELGAGFGHIVPLRALAIELSHLGHECVFALRELETAEDFLDPSLGPVVQAPLRLSPIHSPLRVQVNYASLLHNTGFDDATSLTARLRAWREIIRGYGCELLIADHAPCAVAAAHGLGLPTLQIGTGFTLPPLVQPLPLFRPNLRVSDEVLLHNEAAVLATLGAAYARLGLAAPVSMQQVLGHGQRALLTYPELDHYGIARSEAYLGLPEMAQGMAPEWPAGEGPKLFGYLRPSKHLQALLTALKRLPARVLLRVAGVAAGKLRGFERPGLHITDQPINLRLAAAGCDAFINYGAHGATAEMLLAGKPVLLLPETIEQNLVAVRVQQLGAGLTPPAKGDFNLSAALRQLLDDPSLRQAAEKFAARHAPQIRAQIIPALAERASALIKNPQRDVSAGS
jgi:hypothetical protein